MSERYVNKTDGKFNHGKWVRENMSVMKNQNLNGQGNSLAYRFTDTQQKAVEKFLKKNSTKREAVNERLSGSTFKRMDGLHHVRNMKSAMNFLADIYHELEDEGFEPDEILEFFTMKMEQKLGGRTR